MTSSSRVKKASTRVAISARNLFPAVTKILISRSGMGFNWKVLSPDFALIGSGYERSRTASEKKASKVARGYRSAQIKRQIAFTAAEPEASKAETGFNQRPYKNYRYGSNTKPT